MMYPYLETIACYLAFTQALSNEGQQQQSGRTYPSLNEFDIVE